MVKYDKQLLESIQERDKCMFDFDSLPEKINININIMFLCECGNFDEKMFRYLNLTSGTAALTGVMSCSSKSSYK